MAQEKVTYIFWTGGWDSTYRMVELSRMDITVQPIYCVHEAVPSLHIELERLDKILQMLKAKKETKASFLPVKQVKVTQYAADAEIENSWKKLRNTIRIGSQYIFLAKVAKQFPGIELGIERPNGELSGCFATFEHFGKLVEENGNWKLDPARTDPACLAVFGQMTFPICHITEVEMVENIKKWGYQDVMQWIWFCRDPLIKNKEFVACGVCRPCQQKMESNMEFLLPLKAQKRYHLWKKLSDFVGKTIARQVVRLIS